MRGNWPNVTPFCPLSLLILWSSLILPSHGREGCVETTLGWELEVGERPCLVRAQVWQRLVWLPFSSSASASVTWRSWLSFPQLCLPGAFHLEKQIHSSRSPFEFVNPKKNPRNFLQSGQLSSDFASYLSALSLWQTPLTVRHRVIGLSMGRKLWPWAQSERIWLSGASCEPPLNYKDWALTRLFKGASYTTTVSAFPSWAVVFHSAYYDQVRSGLYTGSITHWVRVK